MKEWSEPNKKDTVLAASVLFILAVSLYRIWVVARTGMIDLRDHQWIWTECRIAWFHVDPYTAMQQKLTVHGLHTFSHISSTPWGLTLGTLLHGAFLPYTYSLIWYNAVRILVLILMLFLLNRKMIQEEFPVWKRILGFLLVPAPWYSISSIITGNNGEAVCFLIIGAVCILEEHELLAGFMMLFAMIKPQIALPFFAMFLLEKRWKTIAVSVTGVFTAWIFSAVWTQTNPLAQLRGMVSFANAMEAGYHVVGILDILRHVGVPNAAALLLSMLAGIGLLAVMAFGIRGKVNDRFCRYSIPAIVSIMWCYKTECDYMILILAALAILELWREQIGGKEALWLLAGLFMLYTKPFSTVLLGRLSFLSSYTCNRLDLYMKTAVIFILVWAMEKSNQYHSLKKSGK